jgi:hypothetical protein
MILLTTPRMRAISRSLVKSGTLGIGVGSGPCGVQDPLYPAEKTQPELERLDAIHRLVESQRSRVAAGSGFRSY